MVARALELAGPVRDLRGDREAGAVVRRASAGSRPPSGRRPASRWRRSALRGVGLWPAIAAAAFVVNARAGDSALGRGDHRAREHAGGGDRRDAAPPVRVRQPARAAGRRLPPGRLAALGSTMVSATFGLVAALLGHVPIAATSPPSGPSGGWGTALGDLSGRAVPVRLGERRLAALAAAAALGRGGRAGSSLLAFVSATLFRHHLCLERHPRDRARDLSDGAAAHLGGAAVRAARRHRGDAARVGDRRLGRRLRQRHLRRGVAARAPAAHPELHGGHGGQHADAGGGAGRATRRDPGARRVHLHRLPRAQDAAHSAQAAARVGASVRRASDGGGRSRSGEDVPRPGGLGRDGGSAGDAGRRPARRLTSHRRATRAARRSGRHRRAPARGGGAACAIRRRRSARRIDLTVATPVVGAWDRGRLEQLATNLLVERDQVRPGQADRGVGRGGRAAAARACARRRDGDSARRSESDLPGRSSGFRPPSAWAASASASTSGGRSPSPTAGR